MNEWKIFYSIVLCRKKDNMEKEMKNYWTLSTQGQTCFCWCWVDDDALHWKMYVKSIKYQHKHYCEWIALIGMLTINPREEELKNKTINAHVSSWIIRTTKKKYRIEPSSTWGVCAWPRSILLFCLPASSFSRKKLYVQFQFSFHLKML